MRLLGGSELWRLAKCSVRGWIDDAAPSMGASLAFYTLFSLTPLLVVVIALAGLFIGREAAHDALVAQIAQLTGARAAEGIRALLEAAGTRKEGLYAVIVGTATLVLGATTVFAELRSDLNRIWRYKPAKSGGALKFLRDRGMAIALVFFAGLLLLGSVVATTLLAAMGERWFPHMEIVARIGEFGVSFALVTVLFAMFYKLLPGPRIEWSDVWVGAAVTSVLFWLGKLAIAYYVTKASYDSTFGAAGAIVIVIAWVYYSAQVFFLGAEFTRQYALRHGSKQNEPPDRRHPNEVANDEQLIQRAERLVRGDDPVLERPRKAG
jgi:membrane protein